MGTLVLDCSIYYTGVLNMTILASLHVGTVWNALEVFVMHVSRSTDD